jgi:TRAP-type C4-dicarboxylate transport system permease small subunit
MSEAATRSGRSPLHAVAVGFVDLTNRLSAFASVVAVLCLCALLALVLAQTAAASLSRFFPDVSASLSVSWEYGGYLMGTAFFMGMARTLRAGGHIRVSLLFDALPGPWRRWADFFASAIAASVTSVLSIALVQMAARSFASNSLSTASYTPLWIPEGAFAFAACLLTLQLVARMIALLVGLPAEQERDFVGSPVE